MELKALSEKINSIKSKKARAEGALERLYEQLKSDYGCSTIEEAMEKQKKLEASISTDQKTLIELTQKIEALTDNWSVL